jgi:hypothetical protein
MAIDFSDVDKMQKEACLACLPDMETKKKLFNDFVEGKRFNVQFLKYSTGSFHDYFDKLTSGYFSDEFFK